MLMIDITRPVKMIGQISYNAPILNEDGTPLDFSGSLLDPRLRSEGGRIKLLPDRFDERDDEYIHTNSPFHILGPTGGSRVGLRYLEITPEMAIQFTPTQDATGHLQLDPFILDLELLLEAALTQDLEATVRRWDILRKNMLSYSGIGHIGRIANMAIGGQWHKERGCIPRLKGAMGLLQTSSSVNEGEVIIHPWLFYKLFPAAYKERENLIDSGKKPKTEWERMLLAPIPAIWREQPFARWLLSPADTSKKNGDCVTGDTLISIRIDLHLCMPQTILEVEGESIMGITTSLIDKLRVGPHLIALDELVSQPGEYQFKGLQTLDHQGNWVNLNWIRRKTTDKPILEVIQGGHVLRATNDHKVKINGEYRPLGECQIGDIIDYSSPMNSTSEDQFTIDQAYALGLFVADGTAAKYLRTDRMLPDGSRPVANNWRYECKLSNTDRSLLEKATPGLSSLFGVPWEIRSYKSEKMDYPMAIRDTAFTRRHDALTMVPITDGVKGSKKRIAVWLRENCYTPSYHKRVPHGIMEGSQEIQKSFIEGLIDGNGYREKPFTVSITHGSSILIEQISIMGENLGLYTALSTYKDRNAMDVTLSDPSLSKHPNAVKAKKTGIRSIKVIPREDVFDVNTDAGQFIANGFHLKNCDGDPDYLHAEPVTPEIREFYHLSEEDKWVVIASRFPKTWTYGDLVLKPKLPTESWYLQSMMGHTSQVPTDYDEEIYTWDLSSQRLGMEQNTGLKTTTGPNNDAEIEYISRSAKLDQASDVRVEISVEKKKIVDQWFVDMVKRIVATGKTEQEAKEFLYSLTMDILGVCKFRPPTFPELSAEFLACRRQLPQDEQQQEIRLDRQSMLIAALTNLHTFTAADIAAFNGYIEFCRKYPKYLLQSVLPGYQILERRSIARSKTAMTISENEEPPVDGLLVLAEHYGVDEIIDMLQHDLIQGATRAELAQRREELYGYDEQD